MTDVGQRQLIAFIGKRRRENRSIDTNMAMPSRNQSRAEWNSEWRMEMDGGDTQSSDTLLQKQKLKQAEGGKKTGDHLVSESELHITI
ncbi:hypothetical protein WR25_04143 [Diploscapter pachys]|uniref:Uncharacterized protein n=1 Tax=Diploscapter pachys TaxID=2018661 RepID=A0A2A2JV12_9BILA|nr:hypothetical protein WR25_04143 [Diploscapter pachys]